MQLAESWFTERLDKFPSLDQLACATGLSERYLRRLFQTVHGCGPKIIMNRIQMNHAVHLLSTTPLKVDAVATACGFTSGSNLFRLFKQTHGMTPAEFRAQQIAPKRRG